MTMQPVTMSPSTANVTARSLAQIQQDNKKSMELAKAKEREFSSILRTYPDAALAVLENNSNCYTSSMVTAQTKGAKPEVFRRAALGGDGRFVVRFKVRFGKNKVIYSKACKELDSRQVCDCLTQFFTMPTGAQVLNPQAPKPTTSSLQ